MAKDKQIISSQLDRFLKTSCIKRVYIAEGTLPPPPLAYMVNFARLSVPLDGCHSMEIEQGQRVVRIEPAAGEAIFEPPNCWNRPTWSKPVKVMSILFGRKQTGISLVDHDGRSEEPPSALKTAFKAPKDGPLSKVLQALLDTEAWKSGARLGCLLVEALLHACLHHLKDPPSSSAGKAAYLFENLCLYVQENFQNPITRESTARHFRISPGHLSRLFKQEGSMSFSRYLTLVRMDRAKFMLKRFSMTLDEVAAGCGFAETAYFCRVFKKTTLVTPTAYRLRGL